MIKDTIIREVYQTDLETKNGIVNQSNIDFIKQTVLFNAVRDHFDIVKTKVNYPVNNKSLVEFEAQFVIIDIERYNQLLKASKKEKKLKLSIK